MVFHEVTIIIGEDKALLQNLSFASDRVPELYCSRLMWPGNEKLPINITGK